MFSAACSSPHGLCASADRSGGAGRARTNSGMVGHRSEVRRSVRNASAILAASVDGSAHAKRLSFHRSSIQVAIVAWKMSDEGRSRVIVAYICAKPCRKAVENQSGGVVSFKVYS